MARRVGECPVPFVFATCLKTSPSCYPRLLLFPCACVFTKRKRTRTEGMPDLLIARHSCPFVRHLIASRGSRGILRGGYLRPLPLSFPFSRSFSALCATSWSVLRYHVHVSWLSMPLDMSSVESRFCVFSNATGQLRLTTHYPSSVNSTIAANVLRAPCRFTTRIACADIFFLSRDALYSV